MYFRTSEESHFIIDASSHHAIAGWSGANVSDLIHWWLFKFHVFNLYHSDLFLSSNSLHHRIYIDSSLVPVSKSSAISSKEIIHFYFQNFLKLLSFVFKASFSKPWACDTATTTELNTCKCLYLDVIREQRQFERIFPWSL